MKIIKKLNIEDLKMNHLNTIVQLSRFYGIRRLNKKALQNKFYFEI